MIIRKLAFLLFLSLLIACDKEELDQTPIDTNVQIEVREVIFGSSSKLVLVGKTKKEYTCSNNTIITTKKSSQNKIEILFKAVKGDKICATALGPATTEVDLGALSNGEYNLQLNIASTENGGLLKVTNTEIRLEFSQQKGIDILTPVVQRK